MSFLHNRFSSSVLLALLAALVSLSSSQDAYAQAGTRPFQMTLWECCGGRTPVVGVDVDIREFDGLAPNVPQPTTGPSVMVINGSYLSTLNDLSKTNASNWLQIAAVEIDEPYSSLDGELNTGNCLPPTSIQPIDNELSALQAKIQAKNPKTRFWVNFTQTEANWMTVCTNPQEFNRAYIDVISVDWYNANFFQIEPFYQIVSTYPATPHQQLALVPGVFWATNDQLGYLQSFFSYASGANDFCSLPLGPQGVTGIYDRCPVWIVMGWMTGDITGYSGILDGKTGAQQILSAWQTEVKLTPVTPTQIARAKEALPAVINLLLH